MNQDKLVVVTGCSRGLGLAISTLLLDQGYRVVGASRTESDAFAQLAGGAGDRASFVPLDISRTDEIHPFARDILDRFGTPWGLVNNAAVGGDGVLGTFHESDIQNVIATNLVGPIALTKYLSRAMLKGRAGRIVNISSIVAQTGYSGLSVYGATKAGIEGFTRSLSRELGKRGITVNSVAPGYMETDMTSGLGSSGLDSVRRRAPLGLARPEEVAPAVAYLLSDEARMLTGSTITVDGGSTA